MPNSDHYPKTDVGNIHETVTELLETGRELHTDLLHTIQTRTRRGQIGTLTPLSHALEQKYETWYSLSFRLISRVLPERKDDFRVLYKSPDESVTDIYYYLTRGEIRHADQVANRLQNQIALLCAAQAALSSVLMDLRATLQANLFDSELDTASSLLKDGLLRPAGVVGGVVLERHLMSVCDNHGLPVGKNVTISKLNEALKKAGVLEVPDWRHIQLLGDLRNKCSHQKENDPTSEDVTDLIEGVAKVIKKVF